MQAGWCYVSKILINKFGFYIVNFNKLTVIVLRKRDTKFERCFPATTILKYSTQNLKNEYSEKKKHCALLTRELIGRSPNIRLETLYLQPSSQSGRCLHSLARLNTYGSDSQVEAHTSWCFITLYA